MGVSIIDGRTTRLAAECFFLPDEPLESSDTVDPERSGTSAEAMVLLAVVVRGCVAMVRTPARWWELEQCSKEIGKCASLV